MNNCLANSLDSQCTCASSFAQYSPNTQEYVCCDVVNYAGEYSSICQKPKLASQAEIANVAKLPIWDGQNYSCSSGVLSSLLYRNPNAGVKWLTRQVCWSTPSQPVMAPIKVTQSNQQVIYRSASFVEPESESYRANSISRNLTQSTNLIWCMIGLLVILIACVLLLSTRPLIQVISD